MFYFEISLNSIKSTNKSYSLRENSRFTRIISNLKFFINSNILILNVNFQSINGDR